MKTNKILPEENNKRKLFYTRKTGSTSYGKKRIEYINSSKYFALQRVLNDHLKHDAA